MTDVWVGFDSDALVVVADTEQTARSALEEHCAEQIDRQYFGPNAQKRYEWRPGNVETEHVLWVYAPGVSRMSGPYEWYPSSCYTSREPLAATPPPGPVDRGFDTTNDFGWGINGHGIITPALPLRPMDRMTALRAAAYLVLLADSQGDLFAAVLERVKRT